MLTADYGVQPVLVGGRSPRELHAESVIMAQARHRPISALGSGLRNLVGILDGSALVLAPDTGPLHMAVALDRPVVSLIGYTRTATRVRTIRCRWRRGSTACRASPSATSSRRSNAGTHGTGRPLPSADVAPA